MKDYLLSVVIPTKNRQFYAIQAIQQILSNTTEEVEIVVQDNSDTNSLLEQIKELNVERIYYNHTSQNLSFVDNFEQAVRLASGKYVTLIGDDDGVLSTILEVTKWAEENNIDAVTSKILNTYYWPHSGAKNYKCSEDLGYIRINEFDLSLKEIDFEKNFIKVVKNGCQFYHKSGIPKIYHGLVKNSIIKKIIEEKGKLFSGLSPDIYSAFMITMYVEKVAMSEIPFTIDGNCPKSGAGAQAQGKHTGSLKDAPHFNGHVGYEWNSLVPYVYSIQTIWADSGLAALKTMNRLDLIDMFSVEKITGYVILNNPTIIKETMNSYMEITKKKKVNAYLSVFLASINGPISNIIIRILRRLKGFGQVGHIINDVGDIMIATEKIEEYINNKRSK